MINEYELRLNNWIMDAKGDPFQVRNIGGNGYVNQGYSHLRQLQYCKPIPLTPEILEKAGFKKVKLRPANNHNYSKQYALDNVDLSGYHSIFINNKFQEWIGTSDNIYYSSVYENAGYDEEAHIYSYGLPFKFVHSLQNLFYALCGEELNVKL